MKKDGSKYYGPYTDTGALRDTFKMLRVIFPFRGCRRDLDREKVPRPCLNYHIKRCLAPCHGGITRENYREMISQVRLFLEGRQAELVEKLRLEMQETAARREYERAALLRDRIQDIEKVLAKQKMVSDARDDLDIFGLVQDVQGSLIQVFQVRTGKLVGREYFIIAESDETGPPEIMEAFLTQYYDGSGYIPPEILFPFKLEGIAAIEEWLAGQRGTSVYLKVPQKGEKAQLLTMAAENAQSLLEQERTREKQHRDLLISALTELQQELELPQVPFRIEGFDISNTQGQEAVASMVVFEGGLPKGGDYRRFKIRTVEGPNDFEMLREAVRRRFVKAWRRKKIPPRRRLSLPGFPISY